MHPRKKEYAREVFNFVMQICYQMSDTRNAAIPKVLNASKAEMLEVSKKIVAALPDDFFYNAAPVELYDMIAFISRKLVSFQIQEQIDAKDYSYHLGSFINNLTLAISTRYYPNQHHELANVYLL